MSKCVSCLFDDRYDCEVYCEWYLPLYDIDDVDNFIEDKRAEFYIEWFEYIDECGEW